VPIRPSYRQEAIAVSNPIRALHCFFPTFVFFCDVEGVTLFRPLTIGSALCEKGFVNRLAGKKMVTIQNRPYSQNEENQ
jgi:hypothetical protein